MAFIRQYKTTSGATGVQICEKRGGRVVKTQHIGSANSELALKKLLEKARRIMMAGQEMMFDLDNYKDDVRKLKN